MSQGYIYILSNSAYREDIVKIGKTTRNPKERAQELHTTGVPNDFVVEHTVLVRDCDKAERIIHEKLQRFRHSQEFFKIPLAIAISEVEKVALEVGVSEIEEQLGTDAVIEDGFLIEIETQKDEQGFPLVKCVSGYCYKCHTEFNVTLVRYETLAHCPECGTANKVRIKW